MPSPDAPPTSPTIETPKEQGAPPANKPARRADPYKKAAKLRRKRLAQWARLKARGTDFLEILATRWPATFPKDRSLARPWAIGIFDDLHKLLPDQSKSLVRAALHRYADSEGYQAAVAAGGPRYDLEGNAKGVVSEEHQVAAVWALKALREKSLKKAQNTQP